MNCDLNLTMVETKSQMEADVQREVDSLCLGAKIRKLRQRRNLTLREVSELSGLSKSLLSQIENEASAPPIPTLIRIAKALGAKIGDFFQETMEDQRISVVRKASRQRTVKLPHNRPERLGYHYTPLAHPVINQHMEPFWIDFEPRQNSEKHYYQHAGEEFLYVQSGKLEFEFGDQTIVIEPGDSLYFKSNIPHTIRSMSRQPASAIAVMYAPDE